MTRAAARKPSAKQRRANRHYLKRVERNKRGRFIASFDRDTLYTIVRDVALVAASLFGCRPTEVGVREWNAARKHVRHRWGRVPQAQEICRQLHDRNGARYPWRKLLVDVFHPTKSIEDTDMERLTVADEPITREAARHAFWRLAGARRTLTIDDYTTERNARLADAAQRCAREARALRACLPTASQIYFAYERDWNAALVDAGLEAGPGRVGRTPGHGNGVSIANTYILYRLNHDGAEPTNERELVAWGRKTFAVARVGALRKEEWLRLAHERLTELSLDPAKPAKEALERFHRELGPLPPPADPPYEHIDVLTAVRRFRDWLEGARATDSAWRRFAAQSDDEPALGTIKRHGGLRQLLLEAAHPDWQHQAIKWQERRDLEKERAKARRARPTPNRKPAARRREGASDRALQALDLLRLRGPLQPSELAHEFGITRVRASQIFAELCRHELARPTQPLPKHPRQAYTVTRRGAATAVARARQAT